MSNICQELHLDNWVVPVRELYGMTPDISTFANMLVFVYYIMKQEFAVQLEMQG